MEVSEYCKRRKGGELQQSEGGERGDWKEGREWRLPRLLYADDLILYGKSEEELRAMVGRFVEVCRRVLKVNAVKSKVMVLNGEEGLECGVYVDETHFEHVSEFKCLGCFERIR